LPDAAIELLQLQCTDSDNMTDVMSALQALVRAGHPRASDFLENFLRSLGDNVQLFDKHSNLVASLQGPQVFAAIEQTNKHRLFSWQNPNRVRALYSAFAQLNPLMFHQIDGSGYQLVAQAVAKADKINPQLAARMITPLLAWRRFDNERANLMRHQLAELSNSVGLSNDVFEKVSRGLA
jgi:aminopeptidase N